MGNITVSIIIPTCHAAPALERCVQSLLVAMDGVNAEMILVLNGSSEESAIIATRVATSGNVRLLRFDEKLGAGEARNRGLQAAEGELVFFTDADCVVAPEWLRAGLAAFADPAVVAVEGDVLYAEPDPDFSEHVPLNPFYNEGQQLLSVPARDFSAACFAARRSALLELGGYRSTRYPNGREDTDLGVRLSQLGTVAHVAAMRVTHAAERWTVNALLQNALRYKADVRFVKDYGFFPFKLGPVLHPRFLAMLLCPPLVLCWFWPKSLGDVCFLPKFYLYLVALRYTIWRAAFTEKQWVL